MDYRVVWEMEIYNAASPEEAARRARQHQKDRLKEEPVMDVYLMSEGPEPPFDLGEGAYTRVDLEELVQTEGEMAEP